MVICPIDELGTVTNTQFFVFHCNLTGNTQHSICPWRQWFLLSEMFCWFGTNFQESLLFEFVRFLLNLSMVTLVHVVSLPFLIAQINVDLTVMKVAFVKKYSIYTTSPSDIRVLT